MKLSTIQASLNQLGMQPTKSLGQNFLHDQNLAEWIVAQLDLQPEEAWVELGPGLGALTEFALALYALAAARAGNARLADFLRQLEPVLLSLANQPGAATVQSSEDLRRFLDATDLLFQVRATEARLDPDGKRRT